MISFKEGVNPYKLTPVMMTWLPIIYSLWIDKFPGTDMIITSGFRDGHPGAHGRGEAIDLRRYYHPAGKYEWFCRTLQEHFGPYLGVQLEPEWAKPETYTGPHVHCQLKGIE